MYGKRFPPLACHGGITFSAKRNRKRWPKNYWYLGFDCAHSGDMLPEMCALQQSIPSLRHFTGILGEVYRDMAYVTEECLNLARQLEVIACPTASK